ncbi:GPO family capsid scaffolding protein [Proteus terrae subsp. cibarius]|uniref:GPO family capsid scaffolding protein n=1 Tax=Proteus terrae TaxID=1574161 RepID=UPI00131F4E52|nr:GPO family capsid scaffolding protein [Proteus terrae]QHD94197.1 GPO family capsid scaffolding protein [Proteus terrae subsp. cibarius]QJW49465.1 GPO family capsid scaffolding protein [Proteus terrae subsp. cibarius]
MSKKLKPVRLCVEGATTDGRKVSREWLTQIAKNFDPAVYGARVNVDHYNYSWAPRFGDVESVYTEEIKEGALAGKLALYGVINPTPDLIELNKKRQKVYTSVEINPSFSDTGEAYLVGLAVTDNPASLGTEMLQFSASAQSSPLSERKQSKDNVFTAAEETHLEFTDEKPESDKPGLFSVIKEMFSKKQHSDDARFTDVHQAVELCAQEVQTLSAEITALKSADQSEAVKALTQQLTELKTQFEKTDASFSHRPPATGGENNGEVLTDC